MLFFRNMKRHFSGIWGHFPECRIFSHRCCKYYCKMHSHKASFYITKYYVQYHLPPSLKCIAESFTSTSSIIFYSLKLPSVLAKDFLLEESFLICMTGGILKLGYPIKCRGRSNLLYFTWYHFKNVICRNFDS